MNLLSNPKSRLKLTRALGILMCLAMVLTAIPVLMIGTAPKAQAVTVVTTKEALANAFSAGGEIKLGGDITWDGQVNGTDYGADITRLTVPNGKTVDLDMNGHNILWTIGNPSAKNGDYHNVAFAGNGSSTDCHFYYLINNLGTLNIKGTGKLEFWFDLADNCKLDKEGPVYYVCVAVIRNQGTLDVGKNVDIKNLWNYEFADFGTGKYCDFVFDIFGIYNLGAATVNCDIDVHLDARAVYTGYVFGKHNSYNYTKCIAVYSPGGHVISNTTGAQPKWKAYSYVGFLDTSGEPDKSRISNTTCGLYTTSNQTNVNNVEITTDISYYDNNANPDGSGGSIDQSSMNCVGVLFYGQAPTVGSGVEVVSTIYQGYWDSGNVTPTTQEAAVGQTTSSMITIAQSASSSDSYRTVTSNPADNATFYDENGNQVTCGRHTNTMVGGSCGTPSGDKVVVKYRFFTTVSANAIYKSYTRAGSGTNDDGYAYRSTGTVLNGVTSNGYLPNGTVATISDANLPVPTNPYYYRVLRINYRVVEGAYGVPADIDTNAGQGTMVTYNADGTVRVNGQSAPASSTDSAKVMYIFVDYVPKAPNGVRANVAQIGSEFNIYTPQTTEVSMTYTGRAAIPNVDFQFKVFDAGTTPNLQDDDVDITNRYDCAYANDGRRQVTYSWGTVEGTYPNTGLPTNSGTFYVQATIPADTTYTRYCNNAQGSRNILGGTYTFRLIINKRTPTLTGPTTQTIVYGAKLSDINISDYAATVDPAVCAVPPGSGTFSFANPDHYVAPVDGTYTATLNWTPTGSTANNFAPTSMQVYVTANKRSITATFAAKTNTYGEDNPYSNDDVNIGGMGLAFGSNPAYKTAVVSEISERLVVKIGGVWSDYSSSTPVGTYEVTGQGDLDNYTVTYSVSNLQIVKRLIVVTAVADNRAYIEGSADITVRFPNDHVVNAVDPVGADLIVNNVIGTVAAPPGGVPGDVGENLLVTFSIPTLSGPKAGNYEIETVTNRTSLRVDILQKAPTVANPTLSTIVYDSTKTLFNHYGEIIASSADGETPGVWKFTTDAASIVPQVNNYGYTATFYPDSTNYATATRTLTVTVQKREIMVAVTSPTISYGDDVPAFTYTFTGFTDVNPSSPTAEYITVIGQTCTSEGFVLQGDLPTIVDYGGYEKGDPAGDYNITWSQGLMANNYTFTSVADCVLRVNKRVLIIQANNASVEYGNNPPTYGYRTTGLVAGDTVADKVGVINLTSTYAAGSPVVTAGYPITVVELPEDNDYYTFQYVNGKLTVTKAILTVTADNKTVTYGDPIPTLTYQITGWKLSDGSNPSDFVTGTPGLTTEYTPGKPVDETYAIYVNVAPCTSQNYALVPSHGTITVNKATPTVSEWPTVAVVNGDSLADASVMGGSSSVSGIFAFQNPDAVPQFNGSHDFEMIFTPHNDNYISLAHTITVVVNPREVSGIPGIEGSLMVGEEVAVITSSLNPTSYSSYDRFEWYIGGVLVHTATTYTFTEADKGKTVTVVAIGDDTMGYTGSRTYTTDDKVTAAMDKPVKEQLGYTIPDDVIYDGQTHDIAVYKLEPRYGDITVLYNGSTTLPKAAGDYAITVNIGSSAYYGAVSGMYLGTFTIEKAPLYLTFTARDKVYDGKTSATIDAGTISIVGRIGTDDVNINLDSAIYKFASPAAGDHDIIVTGAYLTGIAKKNYEITINDVTATIEPKQVTAEAATVTRAYDPAKNYVDLTFSNITGVLNADKSNFSLVNGRGYLVHNGASNDAALSYVDFDISGSAAYNYEVTITNEESLYGIITKAVPAYTVPTPDTVVYSGTQTLAQIPLGPGWTWSSPTTIPTVLVGTYKAVFTPADTANYTTVQADINLSVTKAEAIITVNPIVITYGDIRPAFTVSTAGFSGQDSLATCGGLLKFATDYHQYDPVGNYYASADSSTLFSPNYNFVYEDAIIQVNPRELTVTPMAVNRGYIPGGGEDSYSVTVNFTNFAGKARANDDVSLVTASTVGTINDCNAGTRSVMYTAPAITGSAAGNYYLTIINPAIAVEITKIQPTDYQFPIEATIEFGSSLAYAEFAGESGDGTFSFADPTFIPSAVGTYNTYEVIFTPTDYINYETVTRIVRLVVTENYLTPAVTITGSFYVGNTVNASVSGLSAAAISGGYVQYTWYRIDVETDTIVAVIGDGTDRYVITEEDKGFKLRVDISLISPFAGEATNTTARPVEEQKLSFWERIRIWWYRILAAITALFDNF